MSEQHRTFLAPKHTGTRISAAGVLGRIADGWKVDAGLRHICGVMLGHLEQVAGRFYAGDITAVDDLFQTYDLAEGRDSSPLANAGEAPAVAEPQIPVREVLALLNQLAPRIDPNGDVRLNEDEHCCEHLLYQERERLHRELAAHLDQEKNNV